MGSEDAFEPDPPFACRAPVDPQLLQFVPEAQGGLGLSAVEEPGHGSPKIVALRIEAIEAAANIVARPVADVESPGERQAPQRMSASDVVRFTACRQLLPGKLADRLQHAKSRLAYVI